jgi:hypothetical protein
MEKKINLERNNYWFKWDENASHDLKIMNLIRIEGYEGYGLFIATTEVLHRYNGYADLPTIQYSLNYSGDKLWNVLTSYYLFEEEDGIFSNARILQQLADRAKASEKARLAVSKRKDRQ